MADARPFHWEFAPAPVTREVFRVEGGRPLAGTIRISGAKNAALKLLAAAVLTGERCRLTNVPEIEDVRVMAETLADLGVVVDHPGHGVYEVAAGDVDWLFVPLEAAAKMRASFILFGPLLARFGRVIISNPGGDRIGRRPVNLHVDAMRALGAEIEYRNGYYLAKAPGRLRGAEVTFPIVSVMGTENAMLAATLAEGRTVIRPAAQEPEVDDLVAFLQQMGAAVERTAPDTIVVEGRRRLRSHLSCRGSRRRTPLSPGRRRRHSAPTPQGGDERGAAPEIPPDVLTPQRLVRVDVDRVQVAERTSDVDDVAVHRGRRARAWKLETAGRVVGEGPEFLAGHEVVDSQDVPDRVVPVEQIHFAAADGRPSEARSQRSRPQYFRSLLRPGPQDALLRRGAVPPRPQVSGPVRGVGRGDRDRDEQRGDLSFG